MARFHLESPGDFFTPLAEGDETPEFLRWAIDYQCGPREQHRGDDLELVLRQLRPLAAVGEAFANGNLVGEKAIAHSARGIYEFDFAEVLAYYGVVDPRGVACWSCPANGEATTFPKCIGIFSRSESSNDFMAALEAELESPNWKNALIPVTSPRWYGIWADSPLGGERLEITTAIFEAALHKLTATSRPAADLLHALQTACKLNASVHTQLLPAGAIRNRRWELPAHCGYCSGVRAIRQRACSICGHTNRWKNMEKRFPIGIRPYRAVKISR